MDASEETKFHVAILGNLFATQPVGREIAIYLARHLLQGHRYQDPNITTILRNAVVHVVPVVDGAFEKIWGEATKSMRGNPKPKDPGCNNITADFRQVGEQMLAASGRSSGINQQEASAFKRMLLEERFDLVLNIEGGGSGMM